MPGSASWREPVRWDRGHSDCLGPAMRLIDAVDKAEIQAWLKGSRRIADQAEDFRFPDSDRRNTTAGANHQVLLTCYVQVAVYSNR